MSICAKARFRYEPLFPNNIYVMIPMAEAWAFEPEFLNIKGSPGIDSNASIPPAYIATGGPVRIFSYLVPNPHRMFKNSSSASLESIPGLL
jgi:hypothetical protein